MMKAYSASAHNQFFFHLVNPAGRATGCSWPFSEVRQRPLL